MMMKKKTTKKFKSQSSYEKMVNNNRTFDLFLNKKSVKQSQKTKKIRNVMAYFFQSYPIQLISLSPKTLCQHR